MCHKRVPEQGGLCIQAGARIFLLYQTKGKLKSKLRLLRGTHLWFLSLVQRSLEWLNGNLCWFLWYLNQSVSRGKAAEYTPDLTFYVVDLHVLCMPSVKMCWKQLGCVLLWIEIHFYWTFRDKKEKKKTTHNECSQYSWRWIVLFQKTT